MVKIMLWAGQLFKIISKLCYLFEYILQMSFQMGTMESLARTPVFFKLILWIDVKSTSSEFGLQLMSQNPIDDIQYWFR